MVRARVVDVLPRVPSVRPFLTLVDPLAVVLAGVIAFSEPPVAPLVLAALAALVICRGAGLQCSRLVLSILEDLPFLLFATLATVLTLVVAVSPDVDLGRTWVWGEVALFAALAFTGMVSLRTVSYVVTHLLRLSGRIAHPVLIVGAGATGRQLADALLDRPEHGLTPVGMIDCGVEDTLRGLPLPLVGTLADLPLAMRDLGVDDVVFAFPEAPGPEAIATVRWCLERDHQVFVVAQFYELLGSQRERRIEHVRGVAVMRLHRWGTGSRARLLRRTVDVVASVAGLVVLAPALVLIALAVRLETGPGVLFHQTRVGEGGRTFTLLKFTTVRPAQFGADATTWSIDNESRIGPVGHLLRRTGFDELPQLLNVLRGEMSLIGARPERSVFVDELAGEWSRRADRRRMPAVLAPHEATATSGVTTSGTMSTIAPSRAGQSTS